MIGQLYPQTDDEPFLSAAEVAARITAQFPNARVDEEAANQRLLRELTSLEARGIPSPIIEGHKNLFGKTVDIRVYGDEDGGVRFSVYPDSAIEVFAIEANSVSAESLRALVLRIAGALEYEAEFV